MSDPVVRANQKLNELNRNRNKKPIFDKKDSISNLVLTADNSLVACDPKGLYNAAIMYLFRGFNYKSFGTRLAKLSGTKPNVRAITDSISKNGSTIKSVKLWMFYVIKHKLSYKESLALARKWDVSLRDVRAFKNISKPTLAYIRKLARKYVALTLEKFDVNTVAIINETKVWLGKFVSRKLRFIVQSQGLDRRDLEHELVFKGIQGLMMMYPCVDSYLHATNVVKRVIHNQGINMIHHYTSQKIGRLQVDGAGAFHSKVLSLNDAQLNVIVGSEGNNDMRIELSRLLSKYTGKRKRFIELLCGDYSKAFTNFLIQAGYKVETNEELLDKLKTNDYVKLALRYLNVNIKAGHKFLQELREHFTPYSITR